MCTLLSYIAPEKNDNILDRPGFKKICFAAFVNKQKHQIFLYPIKVWHGFSSVISLTQAGLFLQKKGFLDHFHSHLGWPEDH